VRNVSEEGLLLRIKKNIGHLNPSEGIKMLELEVLPEVGLASETIEFILGEPFQCFLCHFIMLDIVIPGMHFSQAVSSVQSLVGSVRGVHILYSEKDPLGVDLAMDLTGDGIRLRFDPISQRLRTVEVYDLSLVKLKYG